ncbi:MAG: hypothetical protein ACLGIB_11185 [Actinomycetota bacterium]
MLRLQLAQKIDPLEEFLSDPILTVACVMLIVVSVGWMLISRLIVHNLRKAARRGRRNSRIEAIRSERDIWSMPP